jgi:hypothetical protein
MSHHLAEWAREILAAEGLDGWHVVVQGVVRGQGCCNYPHQEIVLPLDAGPGIVLHEIAHVGHPGHGLDWQARLTELVDRYTVEVWTLLTSTDQH